MRRFRHTILGPSFRSSFETLTNDNIDIEKYSISFISKDEESFNKFCKTNEITKDDLQRLGFISSNGNMLFKNRIMFPILSFRNNIIAFGGRAIDDFGPKYLNSSDSVLYKKNRNLYFTNEFITTTKKKGYAFIVEGYFDVLSLNKLGYANSASPSGTAQTYQQLESVSKYTSKILICLDSEFQLVLKFGFLFPRLFQLLLNQLHHCQNK